MPGEIDPPELGLLLDFAERPRVDDWSLRAGLVRYAQREPRRVSDVLDVVRRIEFAFRPQQRSVEKDGAGYWEALGSSDGARAGDQALELLRVMVEMDRLGDAVATWASAPKEHDQPDDAVDEITRAAARRLDELGVAREERQRPPRGAAGAEGLASSAGAVR